jgi:hypothetical protein
MPPKLTDVKLPSGLEVKLRVPGILGLQKIFGAIGGAQDRRVTIPLDADGKAAAAAAAEAASAIDANRGLAIVVVAITTCVVQPQIVMEAPAPEGAIAIDDLDVGDVFALAGEIMKLVDVKQWGAALAPFVARAKPS